MTEQSEQAFPELDLGEPFPELVPRDTLYVVAETVVRTALRKQDTREPKTQLFNKLPHDAQLVVRIFLDTQTAHTRTMTDQVRHQYSNYWQQLYDIIGYHKIKYSSLAGEEPEENTREWIALKIMKLDSAFSQESRDEGAGFIEDSDYHGLLYSIYNREIKRGEKLAESLGDPKNVLNNYGEALAFGEAGLLLEMIEQKIQKDE